MQQLQRRFYEEAIPLLPDEQRERVRSKEPFIIRFKFGGHLYIHGNTHKF